MINYTIADFLTRINNSNKLSKSNLIIPFSCQLLEILIILQTQGFLSFNYNSYYINIKININSFKIINILSKPSRRIYISSSQLRTYNSGLGSYFLRTSLGIKSLNDARCLKLGGELLFCIF